MSSNSEQEMDKHIEVEAKVEEPKVSLQGEKPAHSVKEEEPKVEEEQAREIHTISDAPQSPANNSSPGNCKRSPPPVDSSSPSSLSSDRSSHSNDLKYPTALVDTPPPAQHNQSFREFQPPPGVVEKVDPRAQESIASVTEAVAGSTNEGWGDRRVRPNLSILKRTKRESLLRRALLGLRISGFVFCLISFSVMAADKYQGWALDSFYRYKEFRYCMAVNVIGFAYSGLQAYDLVHYFTNGKHLLRHRLRCYFAFSMDQVLTYLLISASSSAATRVYDWQSNWGEDKFPAMASASVGFSFVASLTFALSSLISGLEFSHFWLYNL